MKVIPAGLSDHGLIGCARKLNNVKFNPRILMCRNFANYSANFEKVYSSVGVTEAWASFRDILQHGPLIIKKVKGRLCPSLTPEVKRRDESKGWFAQESSPY